MVDLVIEGVKFEYVCELVVGQFGLVLFWVKFVFDVKLCLFKLVNVCLEIVIIFNNLCGVWLGVQCCIVLMMVFFEDDFCSGKVVFICIVCVDGKFMGVVGLWECWSGVDG